MYAEPPIIELRRRWPRPYASTWVFLAFLAAILFLANVPGQVENFDYDSPISHGWPLTAVGRGFERGWPTGPPSVWNVAADVERVDIFAIAVNVAVAVMILVVAGVLFQTWRSRRGSFRQFRIAELLALVGIVAFGLLLLSRVCCDPTARSAIN